MIRLLHTADLHLDWSFPPLSANRRSVRRHEVAGLFYQLISLAIEHNVQGVVIAGDLFQSLMPPQECRSTASTGFARLADLGIPVFLAPGHEEGRLGILDRMDWPGNVCVFGNEDARASNLVPGLTVYGFPIGPGTDYVSRPLQDFRRLDRPGVHLGVLHGTYQGLPIGFPGDTYLPILVEDIARSGLDYLALGHYHDHFACVHGGTHAIYPGSPARLDFGQQSARSAVLVTLSEGAPGIERIPLEDRPYLEFSYDLSKRSLAEILTELEEKADPNACARVVLDGAVWDEIDFFATRVRERLAGSFFFLDAVDRTEISLPPPGDTVMDLFVRRSRAALAETDLSPEERAKEEYALRAGLIALKGGEL